MGKNEAVLKHDMSSLNFCSLRPWLHAGGSKLDLRRPKASQR